MNIYYIIYKLDYYIIFGNERTEFMKSTDDNLNNPMVVDTIGIYPQVDTTNVSIEKDSLKRMYLLGSSNKLGEYQLYLNEATEFSDRLVKICRYDDPQVAINALNKFNNVGSHHLLNLQVYTVISQYIVKDIPLHDMLVGVISLFGYRDDIRLQQLLQTMISYNPCGIYKDLPALLKNDIKYLKIHGNYLFKYYSDLYDLVNSYKYFQAKEFQLDPDNVDLSKVVEKVFTIMTGI
jgi:hypothetical protein